MRHLPVAIAATAVWFLAGCGGDRPVPVPAPSYDPAAMAEAAVRELDADASGAVDGGELDARPWLKAFDTDHDKKVSRDELKARFDGYAKTGAGALGYTVRVTLDGRPLPDATVTFTPEAFMNGAVGEATARTGPDGSASAFTAGGQQLPGLALGVYRVAVTTPDGSIPARYNTATTLGCEVSGGRGGSSVLELKLKRK